MISDRVGSMCGDRGSRQVHCSENCWASKRVVKRSKPVYYCSCRVPAFTSLIRLRSRASLSLDVGADSGSDVIAVGSLGEVVTGGSSEREGGCVRKRLSLSTTPTDEACSDRERFKASLKRQQRRDRTGYWDIVRAEPC
jgi:hypothetical protein